MRDTRLSSRPTAASGESRVRTVGTFPCPDVSTESTLSAAEWARHDKKDAVWGVRIWRDSPRSIQMKGKQSKYLSKSCLFCQERAFLPIVFAPGLDNEYQVEKQFWMSDRCWKERCDFWVKDGLCKTYWGPFISPERRNLTACHVFIQKNPIFIIDLAHHPVYI